MNIKFKRLTKSMTVPTKAHSTDACFDLYVDEPCDKPFIIEPHSSCVFHTGFATEIPVGYFAPVFSRSGIGFKKGLRLCNSVGVIDADYRGEWMVKLVNDSDEPQVVQHGDKIAQFTILPVLDCVLEEVEELDNTERGVGGFGSTDK